MITAILASVLALALLVCAGGAVYFLILVPRRWNEPLTRAAELIYSDARDDLERADRLLSGAINAGPRGRVLNEARFAQASVRARLGAYESEQYAAATSVVKDLVLSEGYGPAAAYLDLWLHSRTGNHQRACELYEEHAGLLADRPQGRRAAAASYLQLAHQHWLRREMDGALHYFDRVRELGELTDHIPPGVENLQMVKGIQAAFDDQMETAAAAFDAARERAEKEDGDTVEAELGLLVCDWKGGGDPAELRERLDRLADRLGEGDKHARLRVPVTLLGLVAMVSTWESRPELSGAPSFDDWAELERRAQAVRDADPELGDADLIAGLTRYYFAANQQEREAALHLLERGRDGAKGIMLPEVLELVRRERELGGTGDAIDRYLRLLGEFQADPERTETDRAEYRRIKSRFARFGDGLDAEDAMEAPKPSRADDHTRRIEALRRRLRLIVYPQVRDLDGNDPVTVELRELEDSLAAAADRYAEGVEQLQSTELDLVKRAATVLLPEEEHEDLRD